MSLAGKVALVTGGGKNLGGLISHQFADLGADVAVHYNSASSKEEAEKTVKDIQAKGRKAVAYQGDLTKPAEIVKLFDAVIKEFGGVDIAVNNVGKVLKKPILEITEAEYDSMFAINAKAAFFFIQEAGKKVRDNGKIITIVTSLLAAFTGFYSTYAGSKASVEHFTRAAAKEFASRGISVNNVGPGPMDTPFFYPQESPEAVAYHKSQAIGNRLTDVHDIAPIITFLATSGQWITGQTIFANGGYTTR